LYFSCIEFSHNECYVAGVQRRETSQGLRVIGREEWGPDLGLVRAGRWREIVGPSVGGNRRSLHAVELEPEGATQPLAHGVEAAYYVWAGRVRVAEFLGSHTQRHELGAGAMFHVQPGASYRIAAAGEDAVLLGGPSPAEPTLGRTPGLKRTVPGITTYDIERPSLKIPFISDDARMVVWLGAGAVTANLNYVVLAPGERNKEHVHAYSEDTIHILEGHGTAENVTTAEKLPIGPGDTVQIDVGVWHAVAADRGERVVSVGGPCPADVDMLRAAGVEVDALTVCAEE
jgi:quercetin dioxygenase-like cupin family protein